MSQPTQYTPSTDFSQQEANNASGRSTVNTAALDAEFANIETTVDDICENIALIQRDDGKLADLTVMVHTLSPDVLNLMGGFNLRGLWAAATDYAVNDIASNGEYTYLCVTAHTSGGAFDSQYWIQFGFTGGADAAQAAANAQASANSASNSASTASTAATNASNSASTALTAATNAGNSASAASTSESNAGNSATAASNSASAAATSAANLPNATTAGADKFLKTNTGGTAWEYQTATQARSSLGLTIGMNVQAYDANTAKTNVTQSWTASQKSGGITDNDGSFDLSGAGNNYTSTPTSAVAITFTNIAANANKSGYLTLTNSSAYAFTAHTNTKIAATDLTKIGATGTHVLPYLCDGTDVFILGAWKKP